MAGYRSCLRNMHDDSISGRCTNEVHRPSDSGPFDAAIELEKVIAHDRITSLMLSRKPLAEMKDQIMEEIGYMFYKMYVAIYNPKLFDVMG